METPTSSTLNLTTIPTALDNYKIQSSLIPPDQMAKLPIKEALELLDYIQKVSLLLISDLDIHKENLKNLANVIRNSVSEK